MYEILQCKYMHMIWQSFHSSMPHVRHSNSPLLLSPQPQTALGPSAAQALPQTATLALRAWRRQMGLRTLEAGVAYLNEPQ